MPTPTRDAALALDARDELSRFRDEFVRAEPELIYLDGNSLGRLPVRTRARLTSLVDDEWGTRLVRGWSDGWFAAPRRLGAKLAQLVGAGPDEVVIGDSTSVNLFKLATAALRLQPARTTIVTDDANFPSDLYILQGIVGLLGGGHRLRVVHTDGRGVAGEDALIDAIDGDTALVALSHVLFKSGFLYDMARVSARAREAGALTLWDLSHSVGALPVELTRAGADLAVGCTYKYVNGGPGAPAFLFARSDLQERLANPIAGWFGQRRQFDFALDYEPAPGAWRLLSGTPPMLSLLAVEPGVDLLLEAGLDRLRAKSVAQTAYLIALYDAKLAPLGFTLNSPRDAARRGSHVSIGHPDGFRINRALIEQMQVLPDFRSPDNIRLGVAPLYTSFVDLHDAVQRLVRVLDERRHETCSEERPDVT